MKYLIILLGLMGCSNPPVAPKPEPPRRPIQRTHPLPNPRPPKRMICKNKPTVVAVIDTGFTYSDNTIDPHLCRFGHKDFTHGETAIRPELKDPVPLDSHGHGTNVVGVIKEYAKNSNYCVVIIKYTEPTAPSEDNLTNSIDAFLYATNIGAKYINYSGGGSYPSPGERFAVERFLDRGGRLIAAAGNERSDIKLHPYYPAMYDPRIVSVGSMDRDGFVAAYSNYGEEITRWEYGTDVTGFGLRMSGTSQATAIATGKIINESECDK